MMYFSRPSPAASMDASSVPGDKMRDNKGGMAQSRVVLLNPYVKIRGSASTCPEGMRLEAAIAGGQELLHSLGVHGGIWRHRLEGGDESFDGAHLQPGPRQSLNTPSPAATSLHAQDHASCGGAAMCRRLRTRSAARGSFIFSRKSVKVRG